MVTIQISLLGNKKFAHIFIVPVMKIFAPAGHKKLSANATKILFNRVFQSEACIFSHIKFTIIFVNGRRTTMNHISYDCPPRSTKLLQMGL